ncbi:hypothetical protein ACHAXN_004895 [Cyclotella atomus]
MYQNAPPPHPDIRSQSPAMGMHQPPPQWGASPGYYNPPPSGYYNNGMPPPSPAHMNYGAAAASTPQDAPQRSNSISNTGLIRLTLRKPMGIVFEPMADPHNPSQQRGVRICDLPRTGAAALSQKLEVGDELLSINDKTMSRLTFDEIMEFIIEADAERVDLLFRRPAKDKSDKKGEPLSPGALEGVGSNSNSVKWIDENSDTRHERKNDARDDRRDAGRRRMDDPSVGDDTYTLESQSQYTMDTYDEKYYKEELRRQQAEELEKKGKRRNQKEAPGKKGKRKQDPIESTSFLDMLIDTLCTSVMGRDASGMCTNGGKSKKDRPIKNNRKNQKEEVYNEDDEFTVDDGTYATYEEGGRNKADDTSAVDDGTMYTEDDGTLTKNDEESYAPVTKPSRSLEQKLSHSSDRKETKNPIMKTKSASRDDAEEGVEDRYNIQKASSKAGSRSSPPARPEYNDVVPDPPPKNTTQQQVDDAMEESAIASAALPVRELEYDDRVDYAADVSVMESLGGPSLLVERARHEYAVSSGAGHAAAHGDNIEIQDPELANLVELHGDGFVPDPGLSKEETALRDPYKFYEHAVCTLLQENEPEKVRLLSKLMAKYRGRERHLINKLSARYSKEGGQSVDRSDKLRTASGEHLAKPTISGMEKIHEEGEGEEVTSPWNDPARANLAAIESAKKRIETESTKKNAKKNDDGFDGWPPAMSDPWGAGAKVSDRKDVPSEAGHEDDRHTEDEGSYSEGSSYSGDSLDGTSPAIIAQVSELLNYVYGKTSVAGQIDRVSTIMRAYEGREAVLLELLETKALIKANADTSGDSADLPMSLRNSPGLSKTGNNVSNNSEIPSSAGDRRSNVSPETPVSVLSDPTMVKSPNSVEYPAAGNSPAAVSNSKSKQTTSPNTFESSGTKKKKGLFSGFFGSKKKGKGKFPTGSESVSTSKSGLKSKASKGLSIDDKSI